MACHILPLQTRSVVAQQLLWLVSYASQEFCMKKEKERCHVCTALHQGSECQVFSAKHQDTGARITLDTGFCRNHYVLL